MIQLSHEACFYRARGMLRPCAKYVSTVAPGIFRPCSSFVSTVLEVCSNRARSMFRPCTSYGLTVARGMFWPCTMYISTVLDVCFNQAWDSFERGWDILRPCSMYVSIVLEVCFNRASGVFRACTRYVSTDTRGMFRRAQLCLTVRDCALLCSRPCWRYVSKLCLTQTRVSTLLFPSSTDMCSSLKFET